MTVPLSNLTATWNNGATVFSAIKMNVTDSGHAAASKLLDLQIGGASKFSVDDGGSLVVPGATVTTSKPVLDLAQTWNAGAITFTGLKFNVTATLFADGSNLIDLQKSATSYLKASLASASNDISLWLGPNTTAPAIGTSSNGASLNIQPPAGGTSGDINFKGSGGNYVASCAAGAGFQVLGGSGVGFTAGNANGAADAFIVRDAAQILAQRNSTNPQILRVYNTYTDASNYERGAFDWTTSANIFTISAQAAGTGTLRSIQFFASSITCNCTLTMNSAPLSMINSSISNLVGAPVTAFGDGGRNNNGWMTWAGQARVTADVNSNNTTTLAIATGLSVVLEAGRTYSFEAFLSFTCTAAQGIRAAMVAAGALTATNINYDGWIVDSAANGIKGNAQSAALGTVVANAATIGTAGHVMIRGTITVNVAGNLQVHFAQSVAAANNTTVKRGSYLIVNDMP